MRAHAECLDCTHVEPERYLPLPIWIIVRAVDGVLCRWCGSEPYNDDGDHVEGCPTRGTCAQTEPNQVDPPFHPDAEFRKGDWWQCCGGDDLRAHFAAAHPGVRSRW